MKTTLDIQDGLLAEAKALAARQRLSLTRVVEEGLRLRLREPSAVPAASARPMPVMHGQGLAPGLGGLSTRELLDAADAAP